MRILAIVGLGAAALAAGLAAPSSAARAQGFERPASFDTAKLPGLRRSGPGYLIANPVGSDGFMRIYVLKTPHGDFTVIGDALLRARLVEIAALNQLEEVSNSESFQKALAEAGLSPITYAGSLITKPGETISNTLSGIGSLFGQVGSGLANAGKTPDDGMADLIGVTKRKRELAAKLGVDPYTDFEPLAAKLTQLSEAAAAGGLVVTGALMAIPGVGGLVASNVATTSTISNMARDLTAAQLMDINRKKLAAMGVDAGTAETLLVNRSYTPLDATAIVTALDSMPAVEGRAIFIARAASVHRRDAAFFMRRQAELLADYYAKTGALTGFVALGGYPFNTLRGGGVIGILPLDAISWTDGAARTMTEMTAALKRSTRGGRAELRITGQTTQLAKEQLSALGWTVVENYRP